MTTWFQSRWPFRIQTTKVSKKKCDWFTFSRFYQSHFLFHVFEIDFKMAALDSLPK